MPAATHTSSDQPSSPFTPQLARLLLAAILLAAAGLRFAGLNWGEGQWIHPDEGHMRIITTAIHWPKQPALYFDAQRSPLNSFNQGKPYSYGTLPLFLVRLGAEWLDRGCGDSPQPLSATAARLLTQEAVSCQPGLFTGSLNVLVGRAISALADLGTVLLVYLIGRRLYSVKAGLLASALAALTAFSIQQAHFFTVDSLASFFTVLAIYFSVRAALRPSHAMPWTDLAWGGLAVGLATACKLSAALAALPVALGGAAWAWQRCHALSGRQRGGQLVLALGLAAVLALLAFRIAQPYAFEGPGFFGLRPYQPWWERMSQIQSEQSGALDAPPGQQWANRLPIAFPWLNMVIWGMGLPLGLAAWAGWGVAGFDWLRGRREHTVLWLGTTLLFLYLATQWVKTMRYFLPLYPLLAILAAYGLIRLCSIGSAASPHRRRLGLTLTALVLAGTTLWAAAMLGIYLRPHTRVAGSRWVYENVLPGSVVANEHWDWGLPLPVDGQNPFAELYEGFELANYDEDTPEKRERLYAWLDQADYIFLASNRLYASIARLPARYPLTNSYYRALFAGELGFELAADFSSYPALGPFLFPDQETPARVTTAEFVAQRQPLVVPLLPAEEAFSVYDHPRVLILRKTASYSRARVEAVLGHIDLTQVRHGLSAWEATPPTYRAGWLWFLGSLALLTAAGLGVRLLPFPFTPPENRSE